jgi:hypothetical protein
MSAVAKLRVTYTDGTVAEALAGPRAQVACERHFKKPITEIGNSGSIETVYFLAWAALHFAGKEPRGFDDFLDVLDDVEDAGEEKENPTQPAQ